MPKPTLEVMLIGIPIIAPTELSNLYILLFNTPPSENAT
jgi:hypothetical protein